MLVIRSTSFTVVIVLIITIGGTACTDSWCSFPCTQGLERLLLYRLHTVSFHRSFRVKGMLSRSSHLRLRTQVAVGSASGEVWRFTMRGSHAAPAELCTAVGTSTSATAVTALLVASSPPTSNSPSYDPI